MAHNGLGLVAGVTLECVVCLQHRDGNAVAETRTNAALFDALPYSTCPGCGMEVLPPLRFDLAYRRRARVRHFDDTGRVWPLEPTDIIANPPTVWSRRRRPR